jgi:hypothetical protein
LNVCSKVPPGLINGSIEITLEIQSRTVECPIEVIVAVLLGIAGGLA